MFPITRMVKFLPIGLMLITAASLAPFASAGPAGHTTATATGKQGAPGWYATPVKDTLTCSPSGSACTSIHYKVDGGALTLYSAPFFVSGDGTHVVTYYATSSTGSNETTQTQTLKIDGTPPTSTAAISCADAGLNGWCKAAGSSITTSSTDATSGVASQVCTLDGANAACGTFSIAQGAHTVCVRARDVAGNVGSLVCNSISLDSVAPLATTSGSCAVAGANGWCLDATDDITTGATDATSGVASQTCTLDGSPTTCGVITVGQGTHTVCDTPTDNAGNTGAPSCATLSLDNAAPALSATGACVAPGANGWCKDASDDILASALDATSGVAGQSCTLDSVATSCGSIPVGQGMHTVCVSATDAAGNAAAPQCASLKLDDTPPVIDAHGDVGQETTAASVPVTFDAPAATDATSGLDGAVACTPASGSSFPQGDNLVHCTATDAAGNVATSTFHVLVAPPTPFPTPELSTGLLALAGVGLLALGVVIRRRK